jgi:protein-S-isoprenylcysteine O-methyltransferase Ste14
MSKTPWWKGAHGEWYVVGQVALFMLVVFGARNWKGCKAWTPPFTWLAWVVGGLLMLAGALLLAAAILRLGSNLTAVPYPKEEATLVQAGPYRLVRHPIYCGLILIAFGWALLVHGWLTLAYAAILLAFFDIKSRREEKWLTAKFPAYAGYQKRVRKLIPFVY